MANIVSFTDNIYEFVSRAAREKGNSYDEEVKKFLEFLDEKILDRKALFAFAVANIPKTAEYLEKSYDRDIELYLSAKEKYNTKPKKLFDWVAVNSVIHAEDKKNFDMIWKKATAI